MTTLIRMIRAGRDEGRILEKALDGLAQVFGTPRPPSGSARNSCAPRRTALRGLSS